MWNPVYEHLIQRFKSSGTISSVIWNIFSDVSKGGVASFSGFVSPKRLG
jgi:hypothetical protein